MEGKMKVQVPTIGQIREWLGGDDHGLESHELVQIFGLAVAYANEQLASKSPFLNDLEVHELGKGLRGGVALTTKRPFLSDMEIDIRFGSNACRQGARWARDKYEATMSATSVFVPAKWQPVVGQAVKGWDGEDSDTKPIIGYFSGMSSQLYLILSEGSIYQRSFCAALESIDEIGKPPSYFIERGRCTV
jgi:hypothetical protein